MLTWRDQVPSSIFLSWTSRQMESPGATWI
jgi:hypothetical protein